MSRPSAYFSEARTARAHSTPPQIAPENPPANVNADASHSPPTLVRVVKRNASAGLQVGAKPHRAPCCVEVCLHGVGRRLARLVDLREEQVAAFHRGESPNYVLMGDILYYMRNFSDRVHHLREDVAGARLVERIPGPDW